MCKHPTGHEDLTERIIAAAIEVHSVLGAGLMESVYDRCFAAAELHIRGFSNVPSLRRKGIRRLSHPDLHNKK